MAPQIRAGGFEVGLKLTGGEQRNGPACVLRRRAGSGSPPARQRIQHQRHKSIFSVAPRPAARTLIQSTIAVDDDRGAGGAPFRSREIACERRAIAWKLDRQSLHTHIPCSRERGCGPASCIKQRMCEREAAHQRCQSFEKDPSVDFQNTILRLEGCHPRNGAKWFRRTSVAAVAGLRSVREPCR